MSEQYSGWLRGLADLQEKKGKINPCPKALRRAADEIERLGNEIETHQQREDEIIVALGSQGILPSEIFPRIKRLRKIIVEIGICSSIHDPIDRCPYCEIERLRAALERIVEIDDNYHSSLAIHKALEIAREALRDSRTEK